MDNKEKMDRKVETRGDYTITKVFSSSGVIIFLEVDGLDLDSTFRFDETDADNWADEIIEHLDELK